MNEELKKKNYQRKKALYDCNKQLLEIDPNLIIQVKLKWSDAFNLTNLFTIISYMLIFKKANRTKKIFGHSAIWLFAQYNILSYYYTVYPFILLKNTIEVLDKENSLEPLKTK
jgi:hypothetical protein